jgi:hypothetical protein
MVALFVIFVNLLIMTSLGCDVKTLVARSLDGHHFVRDRETVNVLISTWRLREFPPYTHEELQDVIDDNSNNLAAFEFVAGAMTIAIRDFCAKSGKPPFNNYK